ncbi:hypothetical protein BOW39_08545 [Solemya velum gill symbiont]|uniref:hypothetical protein n=1 Tax=Solemya velum gill symbiont TaxID=2340 RepID=UPI00099675F4|nr:hypothetical protein [Solemya velum gill symbiont]OOZ48947.1 hypothetical protein BOW39_08545 [Solemya velum gill symbiont]OOZ77083.1 hypothetical protein BOW50_08635 [Solemya velum gill symbiont]
MKQDESRVSQQAEELLGLTSSWAEKRCAEISAECDSKVQELLETAHHDARVRLRSHFESDRTASRQRLAALEAAQERHKREELQRHEVMLVKKVIEGLKDELTTRWKNDEQRPGWVETIWQLAHQRLIKACWTISHPQDWSSDEVAGFEQKVNEYTGIAPVFVVSDDIEAGLLIEADGAKLDCTLKGLLSSRYRLESEIIAALEQDENNQDDS